MNDITAEASCKDNAPTMLAGAIKGAIVDKLAQSAIYSSLTLSTMYNAESRADPDEANAAVESVIIRAIRSYLLVHNNDVSGTGINVLLINSGFSFNDTDLRDNIADQIQQKFQCPVTISNFVCDFSIPDNNAPTSSYMEVMDLEGVKKGLEFIFKVPLIDPEIRIYGADMVLRSALEDPDLTTLIEAYDLIIIPPGGIYRLFNYDAFCNGSTRMYKEIRDMWKDTTTRHHAVRDLADIVRNLLKPEYGRVIVFQDQPAYYARLAGAHNLDLSLWFNKMQVSAEVFVMTEFYPVDNLVKATFYGTTVRSTEGTEPVDYDIPTFSFTYCAMDTQQFFRELGIPLTGVWSVELGSANPIQALNVQKTAVPVIYGDARVQENPAALYPWEQLVAYELDTEKKGDLLWLGTGSDEDYKNSEDGKGSSSPDDLEQNIPVVIPVDSEQRVPVFSSEDDGSMAVGDESTKTGNTTSISPGSE